MRKPKMEWSDEFDFEDADFTFSDEEYTPVLSGDEQPIDDLPRALAPWQQIEERNGLRRLQSELSDWDYWDDYMAVH